MGERIIVLDQMPNHPTGDLIYGTVLRSEPEVSLQLPHDWFGKEEPPSVIELRMRKVL